jgi:TatA/E family protein of Tat protein translocase
LLPRLTAFIIEIMNLGMPEMIFIFLLALVIFGPKKLPELGRQLGKALAEFKKASNEFKNQLEVEMMNIDLEERAKRQETEPATVEVQKILPAEKPFDTVIVPAPGAVSREFTEPRPETAAPEPALPSAESPTNGNARAVHDA